MIGCIRETGLVAPLAGGALMAAVLTGVSACGGLSFGVGEQEAETRPPAAEAAPATAVVEHVPVPEEQMPPPFEAAGDREAPPLPREKPALMLTVEPGDSLGAIAQRYGVAARIIIAMNDLSDPYWLLTGQRLALPLDGHTVVHYGELPAEKPRPCSTRDGCAGSPRSRSSLCSRSAWNPKTPRTWRTRRPSAQGARRRYAQKP